MVILNKLLVKQMYHIYKRQGYIGLHAYLITSLDAIISRYFRGSFSQKSEDLIIDKFFNHKTKGFYIDIGAYHPQFNSNTKYFYDKGWYGINIEPNPSRISLFKQERKRDINLNVGIGVIKKMAIFYEFDSTGFSTFSKKEADHLIKLGYKLRKKIKIQMQRLEEVMKKYVKSGIDFMTVDTEALDLEVLKSNNWKKYRPKLLCIETLDLTDLLSSAKEDSSKKDAISKYLLRKGYEEYFSNGLNTLYIDSKQTR